MWLRLTDRKGEPVLVNMDRATKVYPTWRPDERGSLIFFASSTGAEDGGEEPTEVHESIDEIEARLRAGPVVDRA